MPFLGSLQTAAQTNIEQFGPDDVVHYLAEITHHFRGIRSSRMVCKLLQSEQCSFCWSVNVDMI